MKNSNIRSSVINSNAAGNPAVSSFRKQFLDKMAKEIDKIDDDIKNLESEGN